MRSDLHGSSDKYKQVGSCCKHIDIVDDRELLLVVVSCRVSFMDNYSKAVREPAHFILIRPHTYRESSATPFN